jgi:hypothetical protein
MPGGSVTKIERTYKKWTYIARKQNIQLTKKQQVHLTKNGISRKVTENFQNKCPTFVTHISYCVSKLYIISYYHFHSPRSG